ncbi:MAG: hypothetical protein AABX72_03915 [Nanoarchaeota archaeon]
MRANYQVLVKEKGGKHAGRAGRVTFAEKDPLGDDGTARVMLDADSAEPYRAKEAVTFRFSELSVLTG